MNRTEFVTATAIILFLFFCLGWLACWVLMRFTRVTRADISELDQMATALHQAEEARDEAMTYMDNREAELTNRLNQTEAELGAAMDGLREARRETEELRTHLDKLRDRH